VLVVARISRSAPSNIPKRGEAFIRRTETTRGASIVTRTPSFAGMPHVASGCLPPFRMARAMREVELRYPPYLHRENRPAHTVKEKVAMDIRFLTCEATLFVSPAGTDERLHEISEEFRDLISTLGKNLEPAEDWPPLLLVQLPNDDLHVFPAPPEHFESDFSVQEFKDRHLPHAVASTGAVLAGFANASWAIEAQRFDGGPVRDSPHRFECVSCFLVDQFGRTLGSMGRIERSTNTGPRILGWSPPKECGGDFVEALLSGVSTKAELQ
jgi:hypothetical protein